MPKPFVIVSHALPEDWLKLITDKCDLIIGPEKSKGFSQDLIAHLDIDSWWSFHTTHRSN